ncbi:MAG: enoyl-CoA hydratase [Rhodospirillaceae bacterium]
MTGNILTEKSGSVLTLRFNRADKKNALLTDMYADSAAAMREAADDPSVRVLVITGSGDSFTAGNDLKDFLENPPDSMDAPVFRFMQALSTFPKPVIAAVNGVAVGIGTTMLPHCDLVDATPRAVFQLPFVNIALVPEFASTLLLPRIVGNAQAAELLLLGEAFDANRALALGLVNGVVAPDALMETVTAKATALATKPPASLRRTKALLRANTKEIAERISLENEAVRERLSSAEFKEAGTAFFEKRAPDFSQFD